ncbi:hypothetical protein R1flu_010857 [Riccia fluitans]|uniref:Uncharacterized protein n=1 Tax=Riccia fluitans TaxID=41844 RepID=A0ABD1Z6C6_9MARC
MIQLAISVPIPHQADDDLQMQTDDSDLHLACSRNNETSNIHTASSGIHSLLEPYLSVGLTKSPQSLCMPRSGCTSDSISFDYAEISHQNYEKVMAHDTIKPTIELACQTLKTTERT